MVAIVLVCNMFTVLSAVERKLAHWLTCREEEHLSYSFQWRKSNYPSTLKHAVEKSEQTFYLSCCWNEIDTMIYMLSGRLSSVACYRRNWQGLMVVFYRGNAWRQPGWKLSDSPPIWWFQSWWWSGWDVRDVCWFFFFLPTFSTPVCTSILLFSCLPAANVPVMLSLKLSLCCFLRSYLCLFLPLPEFPLFLFCIHWKCTLLFCIHPLQSLLLCSFKSVSLKWGQGCLMPLPPPKPPHPFPGISGLSFDSPFLSPPLLFCRVLLFLLSCHSSANGLFWLFSRKFSVCMAFCWTARRW